MGYLVDGYEVVPFLSPNEVATLRSAVSDHIDRVARALFKPYAETAPDTAFDERIEHIAQTDQSFAQLLATAVATDIQYHPDVAQIAYDDRLAALAERLTGCPIEDRIARMRLNSSALSQHRQAWHSDVAQTTDTECSTLIVTAWIPLTTAGPETGGLELIPGVREQPVLHDQSASKFTINPTWLPQEPPVTPSVQAGDCLLMDRFTPHRAIENRSGRSRWSLVVWMKTSEAACRDIRERMKVVA